MSPTVRGSFVKNAEKSVCARYVASVVAVVITGGLVAAGCTRTDTVHATTTVPVGVTATQDVPGPTVTQTVTQTVSPPPPPAGSAVGTWSGSGSSVTPSFNVPASGDYILSWAFSGNDSGGTGGDNFIINNTNQNNLATSMPNLIQTSGSGSTEVTGASGTDSFNVQSDQTCSWTLKVVSAP